MFAQIFQSFYQFRSQNGACLSIRIIIMCILNFRITTEPICMKFWGKIKYLVKIIPESYIKRRVYTILRMWALQKSRASFFINGISISSSYLQYILIDRDHKYINRQKSNIK